MSIIEKALNKASDRDLVEESLTKIDVLASKLNEHSSELNSAENIDAPKPTTVIYRPRNSISETLKERIKKEECARILNEIQQRTSETLPLLQTNRWLTESRARWLEKTGSIMLALMTACLAIIVNYVVFLRMLHISF